MRHIWFGLDISSTKTGVAVLEPGNPHVLVHMIKGNPVEQFYQIIDMADYLQGQMLDELTFHYIVEELHHTQNFNTVKLLMEYIGYIKWHLIKLGYEVNMIHTSTVRSYLKTHNKKETLQLFTLLFKGNYLTDDHTDALGAVLAHLKTEDLNALQIYNWPKTETK